MTAYRYAVYWAPAPDHPLWVRGSRWLGWDALRGEAPPPPDGIDPVRWQALVAAPRRYGLHATVKAPFRLAEGRDEDDLLGLARDCLRGTAPIGLSGLTLAPLGDFLALRPLRREPALHALADRVVEALDGLRRPDVPPARPGLTPSEAERLRRWGYPYVFEHYRFHLSLTGPLSGAGRDIWRAELDARFRDLLDRPLTVDALCLFTQMEPEAPFRLSRRIGFDGSVTPAG